ncbi:hypothetical protein LJB86_00715 [Deltaproteobacteria bacterium OttesenSCG-928-M10]|nr:hypothetical protein [Deltaproteobacteria bacterium OttesenSCG-928-M10]
MRALMWRILLAGWLLVLALSPGLSAQDKGAEGPAADLINLTFAVPGQWAMYGSPQEKPLDDKEFQALAAAVRDTKFAYPLVQIVVILRNAEAEGTLGLIEKRGKRLAGVRVEEGGATVYSIWHDIGYSTSPERMFGEHAENILAAEEKYRNLPVLFYGAVRRVAKDAGGDAYVEFNIRHTNTPLVCYPWLGAPQAAEIKDLKAGDRLRVSGQFTDWSAEGLKVRGCLFSRQ